MQDTPEFAQMQTIFFPLIASGVFVLMHIVIYFLLVRSISHRLWLSRVYACILWGNMLFCIGYMWMRSFLVAPKWLFFVVSISVGVAFSFLIAALIALFINITLFILRKPQQLTTKVKRTILVLCFVYSGYALYHGLEQPIIKRASLELEGLEDSLRVAQISDVHIGGLIDTTRATQIVHLLNDENPDIIVITGDFVDTKLENAIESLEIFKALRAKYGVYYVLGNHEYLYDIEAILSKLKSINITPLINETMIIWHKSPASKNRKKPFVNLSGVTDLMGNRMGVFRPDFPAALAHREVDIPTIFLTHQPKAIEYLNKHQLASIDFIFSGHTHGGQIFPFSLAVLAQQPYLKGLHKIDGGGYIYVSEGSGFWGPPMRAFSDSEIAVFDFIPPK